MRQRNTYKESGFTLTELLVAMSIFLFVFGFVAFLMRFEARLASSVHSLATAETQASIAIENMRYRLMMSQLGSIEILDDGHTIEFHDPNMDSESRSRFTFSQPDRELYYYVDVDDATYFRSFDKLDDVTFFLPETSYLPFIYVQVVTQGHDFKRNPRIVMRKETIYVRN